MTHHMHEWQLQEAKNKLSAVINCALLEGPQMITLRGKETAVVLSVEEYRNLTRQPNTISKFFALSPLYDLDLSRSYDLSRDVEL